jgi:hypothetical protein
MGDTTCYYVQFYEMFQNLVFGEQQRTQSNNNSHVRTQAWRPAVKVLNGYFVVDPGYYRDTLGEAS